MLLLLSLNIGFYFKQQPLLVKTNPKKINPRCTGGGTLARKREVTFLLPCRTSAESDAWQGGAAN